MKLVKASPTAKVTGEDELPGRSNYFIGNDPNRWRSNVPTYAKVKYEQIYSGIDLIYYGNQRQLEYDFVVAPGADPHRIQFEVRGAKRISQGLHGELVIQMAEGEVRWGKPIVYQEQGGTRREVASHYVIRHRIRIGFEVADYDLRKPLLIDPLIYSTYLGGSGNDQGLGIAIDGSGNAYVAGATSSTNFPITSSTFQSACGNSSSCAFVTKLNSTGSALVYSTYLGGSGNDQGLGIAVDASGNAYVAGVTSSSNFPVTSGAFQTACGNPSSCANAFVTKLNSTGSALVYSTFLGGSGDDAGFGIAVDSSGDAYVVGETSSTNFPTMNPLQPAYAGGSGDAFVSKLNARGSALLCSTYLGGSDHDWGQSIAVDSSGDAYVTGVTFSTNFPTMNPFQSSNGGADDAFVSELNPSGSTLIYSTYLGGSSGDAGSGIAVDGSGNAYVAGGTSSINFPITPGALQTACGTPGACENAFVAKLGPTGSVLVYSTYLGGSSSNFGSGIAVDSSGDAYVTGFLAFVSELNPTGSALVYSTNLGSSGYNQGFGIAVDSAGNAYVTGETSSTNFPTENPLQPAYGGGNFDAFVAKINNAPSALLTLVPSQLDFSEPLGIASAPQKSILTNTGQATLAIASIQLTGTNSGDFAESNNCGNSLSAGGSCQIRVSFTPSATATSTAAVTIIDNASGSPQSLSLGGTGQDFSLVADAPTTVTVTPGQAANYYVYVSPVNGFNQTVTFSCSGAPAQSTCIVNPGSLAPGPTADVAVATTAASAALTQPYSWPPAKNPFGVWGVITGTLGLAGLMGTMRQRRTWRPQLMYGVTLLCLLSLGITLTACGGGSSSSSGGSGTAAGTYTLTVTGTYTSGSTTLKHNTTVTLVVQ